jgi:UDP-N-acetylmuramoyl-L-alanyl-D-glutamate--2,6-diaminopimelate ligase
MAIKFAEPKDIVLVAGKGHENYQEINGLKHHFDDKEIIVELARMMSK